MTTEEQETNTDTNPDTNTDTNTNHSHNHNHNHRHSHGHNHSHSHSHTNHNNHNHNHNSINSNSSEQVLGHTNNNNHHHTSAATAPPIYPKNYQLHKTPFKTTERIMSEVEYPTTEEISDIDFWEDEGKPNCMNIKEHLRKEGRISQAQFVILIDRVYEILCREENILEIDEPITVCGDIHGQFYDLLKILEVGGDPGTTNYLFLGDYVDRGLFSMECIILLFCYKLYYPNTFLLLRGNHECRHLSSYFTFKRECEFKYGKDIYDSIMDCFDALPLAAIMNKQFFCIHGGLSPDLKDINDIQNINRFCEPPPSGIMCDLLWSDPMENFSSELDAEFKYNSVRGCSYSFSYNAACDFIEYNGILSIIRAHEAQDAGYKMHKTNHRTGFPSLITIFSAPNYLDSYNNKGAIMRYENNTMNIRQFNSNPHPFNLPGFMNVFNWSLPFLADQVVEILLVINNLVDDVKANKEEEEEKIRRHKRAALRGKVLSMGRVLTLYRAIQQNLQNNKGTLSSTPPPAGEPNKFNVVNEPRPPGLVQIIEASKKPGSPAQLMRKESRDKILQAKKPRGLPFGTKITGATIESIASKEPSL